MMYGAFKSHERIFVVKIYNTGINGVNSLRPPRDAYVRQ